MQNVSRVCLLFNHRVSVVVWRWCFGTSSRFAFHFCFYHRIRMLQVFLLKAYFKDLEGWNMAEPNHLWKMTRPRFFTCSPLL